MYTSYTLSREDVLPLAFHLAQLEQSPLCAKRLAIRITDYVGGDIDRTENIGIPASQAVVIYVDKPDHGQLWKDRGRAVETKSKDGEIARLVDIGEILQLLTEATVESSSILEDKNDASCMLINISIQLASSMNCHVQPIFEGSSKVFTWPVKFEAEDSPEIRQFLEHLEAVRNASPMRTQRSRPKP